MSSVFRFQRCEGCCYLPVILRTIEEAQAHVCPWHTTFNPEAEQQKICDEPYALYRKVYFAFGRPDPSTGWGDVLPKLIQIARPQPQSKGHTQ
jgi:L-ribulokinase